MKHLPIILGLLFSQQALATDVNLRCENQNSSSVFQLRLSAEATMAKLITLIGDSTVLSVGTKNLKIQEGESSDEMATYAGRSNLGLYLALLFNPKKAINLNPFETLEVTVYYQQKKGDILSGKTLLLCRKK